MRKAYVVLYSKYGIDDGVANDYRPVAVFLDKEKMDEWLNAKEDKSKYYAVMVPFYHEEEYVVMCCWYKNNYDSTVDKSPIAVFTNKDKAEECISNLRAKKDTSFWYHLVEAPIHQEEVPENIMCIHNNGGYCYLDEDGYEGRACSGENVFVCRHYKTQ